MKKFLIIFALTLVFAMALPTFVFADTSTNDEWKQSETYKMLEEFVTKFPDRTGSLEEKAVAEYLVEQFATYGYAPHSSANGRIVNGLQTFTTLADTLEYQTFNAVALKRNETSQDYVVIGAHYDAIGAGANDNASGVVALLQIAKELASRELPFNVIFVAFGGEEQGLYGSQYFVDSFQTTFNSAWANIRVMFNMDSIANGDNLYLHCENKSTDLADLILSCDSNNLLREKPYAVGVYNFDSWGYGYYETIQGSDHTPFRVVGVPVANFFSGNFVNWDFVESKNPANNTMNTSFDNLENVNAQWIEKIDTVVSTVCATMDHQNFDSISQNARSQLVNLDFWYNSLWPIIALLVIVILLVVWAFSHYKKLQKQALLGTAEIKNNRVFETPDADDIFKFDD